MEKSKSGPRVSEFPRKYEENEGGASANESKGAAVGSSCSNSETDHVVSEGPITRSGYRGSSRGKRVKSSTLSGFTSNSGNCKSDTRQKSHRNQKEDAKDGGKTIKSCLSFPEEVAGGLRTSSEDVAENQFETSMDHSGIRAVNDDDDDGDDDDGDGDDEVDVDTTEEEASKRNSGNGEDERCNSASSSGSGSSSAPLAPSYGVAHGKGSWNLLGSLPAESKEDEVTLELKTILHPPHQRLPPGHNIKCEKSSGSSPASSPDIADSANSLISSNNSSHQNSYECRQMRCNRSDGNTDTAGNSNNNKTGNNNNNNNNNVEKVKIAPMVLMNNLPYMGELTFDTRPRRGRKPKKADICHLISKNYGIQFPNSAVNTPTSSSSPHVSAFTSNSSASTGVYSKSAKNKPSPYLPNPRRSNNNASSNHQHHITTTNQHHANPNLHHQQQKPALINSNRMAAGNEKRKVSPGGSSSGNVAINPTILLPNINWNHHVPPDLLPLASVHPAAIALLHPKAHNVMKKISMNPPSSRNYHEHFRQQQEQLQQSFARLSGGSDYQQRELNLDEPLNLCVRDKGSPQLTQLDFLSLSSEATGFQSGKRSASALFSNFNLKHGNSSIKPLANTHGKSQVQLKRGGLKRGNVTDIVSDDPNLVNLNLQLNLSASKLANYVNSANNNRPMTFGSSNSNFPSISPTESSRLSMQPLAGRGVKTRRKRTGGFTPKNASASTMSLSTPPHSAGHNAGDGHHNHQHFSHTAALSSGIHGHNAVDISNSSPFAPGSSSAAEVSICKFKFTGGAKPSLQEKKMLSLDSTGNFRFYSDKSCASSSASGKNSGGGSGGFHTSGFKDDSSPPGELLSAHGLPKSAKSMSMCMPVPILPLSTCPAVSPSLPPVMSPADLECSSSSDGPTPSLMATTNEFSAHHHDLSGNSGNKMKMKRKRRTRKSLMREKLEKTFKEKGFLIQTQQLESAEGATYCKFRQLRKFTRYLFRSWKDYLPDNLKGANSAGHDESTPPSCVGTQPMLSSGLSESMEQDQCQEDTEEGRSETPDNLTLSPAGGPNHVDENEDEDDDELDDKDEDIGT